MSRVVQPVKQTFNWWCLEKGISKPQMTLPNAKCQDFLWGLSFLSIFAVHATVGTLKKNCFFLRGLCPQLSGVLSYLQDHCQLPVKSQGRDWLSTNSKCLQHRVFLQTELTIDHRRTPREPSARCLLIPGALSLLMEHRALCQCREEQGIDSGLQDCKSVTLPSVGRLNSGDGRLLDAHFCTLGNNKNLMLWGSRGHSSAPGMSRALREAERHGLGPQGLRKESPQQDFG